MCFETCGNKAMLLWYFTTVVNQVVFVHESFSTCFFSRLRMFEMMIMKNTRVACTINHMRSYCGHFKSIFCPHFIAPFSEKLLDHLNPCYSRNDRFSSIRSNLFRNFISLLHVKYIIRSFISLTHK